jgi:hypothetical protein
MIAVPLKQFLVTEQRCPDEWRAFDLYLFRDDQIAFYVGQSENAFNRVWEHFFDGFKGRSTIGRFILCNWPASMKFTIDLRNSADVCFAAVDHDRSRAEQLLIEQHTPCFNVALNPQPLPLPARYAPTTTKPKCSRSPRKLIMEASIALQAEQRHRWLADLSETPPISDRS